MIIKTAKNKFQMVPEGQQQLKVTKVELLPSGKPQNVKFTYKHANGGTLLETLKLSHPVASDILGQRCDIALGGVAEGTPIDLADVPAMFLNKIVTAQIVHNVVEGDDGKTRTYANIKYITEVQEEEDGTEEL